MFSQGTPVSSTNKTDCHYINEILLIVALNTITLTLKDYQIYFILKIAIKINSSNQFYLEVLITVFSSK
jgi:hypothetical protein